MLVVVADNRRSQFYVTDRLRTPWTNVESLINAGAALAEHDLGSDAPGRTMNRTSGARQAYTPASSIHEVALRKFARQIAEAITHRTQVTPLAAVALVAEPRLLREIKVACPPLTRARIALELPKDLGHAQLPELADRLRAAAAETR